MNDRSEADSDGDETVHPGSNGKGDDDVLRDIIERTRQDPHAFIRDPMAVAAAYRLRQRDPAAWLDRRRELKANGAPMPEVKEKLKEYAFIERQRLRQAASGSGGLPAGFVRDKNGICRIDVDSEGRVRRIPLCCDFTPLASTRDATGDNWGMHIEFKTKDGRVKRVALAHGALLADPAETLRLLGDAGFNIADTSAVTRSAAVDLLYKSGPGKFVTAVDRIGWANDCASFVFGDGTVFGAIDTEAIVFQPRRISPVCGELRARGALEQWQESVSALAIGNPVLMFVLCLSFTGPLLEPLGHDGFGMHLRGRSSRGKTSVQRAAASVWGSRKIVLTWRTTANGVEGNAVIFNSTLFVIDEINQADGKEAAAVAYMIVAGMGKGRADRSGAARAPAQWATVALSSGEVSLADKIAEVGRVVKAGQEVRLLDLPVTERTHGVFDDLHGHTDPATFANHLRDQAAQHFGTAGPAFVAKLLDDPDWRDRIAHHLDVFRTLVRFDRGLTDDEGQARRAIDIFALVAAAGELATHYGITGWSEGAARKAVFSMFNLWVDTRGSTNDLEEHEALNRVQAFLNAHSGNRFLTITDDLTILYGDIRSPLGKAGWKDKEGYYILPATWQEIHKGSDAQQAARILLERDLLISDKRTSRSRHLTRRTPYAVEDRPRCYFVRKEIIGADFTDGGNGDE